MNSPDRSPSHKYLVSTSVVEVYAISVFASLTYSLVNPDLWRSPRIEEWFGWATSPWSLVFFFASVSTSLAIPLTGMALLLDLVPLALPKKVRLLFPVTLWGPGSPVWLGAIIRVLAAILALVLFCVLVADA
jgi:hypothetical protein